MRFCPPLSARLVTLVALATAASGCPILPATNPFDPDAPSSIQARGGVAGTLVIERTSFLPEIMLGELEALEVLLVDGDDELVGRAACTPSRGDQIALACDGADGTAAFAFDELAAGRYRVDVTGAAPDLVAPAFPSVDVSPGVVARAGTLRFREIPIGTAGDGVIEGTASLSDSEGGPRTVTLYRRTGTGLEIARTTTTDGEGGFAFSALGPGSYGVQASLTGFTPDFRAGLDVLASSSTTGPTVHALSGDDGLVLHPITAVLVPQLPNLFGTFYTSDDELPLAVLAFGGVNEMRLSTDAAFSDGAGGSEPYVPYSATTVLTLPDVEGPITAYAQFRNTLVEDFPFTTELFSTTVVRDVSAPAILDVELMNGHVDADGQAWLNASDDAEVFLRVRATDAVSAIERVATYHDDAGGLGDPAALPFTLLEAPAGYVDLTLDVPLTAGDGEKTVAVYLKDRAGNTSEPFIVSVIVDTIPPVLGDETQGIPPLAVTNATVDARLAGRTADVAFSVADDISPSDEPVEMRLAQAPLPSTGTFEPFVATRTFSVTGGHGAVLSFSAEVRDRAGNAVVVDSPLYTLDLSGTVSGKVLVEGQPATSGVHAGTTVRLFDPGAAAPRDTATTDASGSFAFASVPEGSGYTLEAFQLGTKTVTAAVPFVPAQGTSSVGTLTLPLARGNVSGVFKKSDALDDTTAHGGILVTAYLDDVAILQTVTQGDGSYTFPYPGLPITTATARYSLVATLVEYATASADGIAIAEDETTIVNPDPGDPTTPLAVTLAPLSGDFTLCPLVDPCDALLYTNANGARVALPSETGVTAIRFQARTSFGAGDANPTWQAYVPGTKPVVDLSGADGQISVYVQVQIDGVPGPVLESTIVKDTVAPTVTAFTLTPETNALTGFARTASLSTKVTAEKGNGNVAPLQVALVTVDGGPATSCPHAPSNCVVNLPGAGISVVEKAYVLTADSCDAAGNCTTAAASVDVVYDETEPRLAHGVQFEATGAGVTTTVGGTFARTSQFDLALALGTARDDAGVVVTGPGGVQYPDVVAYRFLSKYVGAGAPPPSPSFDAVPWTTVGLLTADDVLPNVTGPGLAGLDGAYRLYGQFRDAAGNVTAVELNPHVLDVALDTTPPPFSVAVSGGAVYTTSSDVDVVVTSSSADPLVSVDVARDDGLFASATTTAITASPQTVAVDLTSFDAFQGDGAYAVHVRGRDAAGWSTDRSVTVTLDSVAPVPVVVGCGSCRTVDDALISDVRTLILDLLATDVTSGIASTRIAIDGGPVDEEDYTGTALVTLPDVEGPHTVSVSFVDRAGNVSAPELLAVTFDETAPTVSLTVNGGAVKTASRNVSLAITASADVVGMAIVDGASLDCATASYTGLQTTVAWTLPATDGSKTVTACFVDAAGLQASASDSILLDTTAPSGAFTIDGGATYTQDRDVAIALTFPSDTNGYALQNGYLDCATATYAALTVGTTSFSPAALHQLPPGEGEKIVSACFRDDAGNTAGVSRTISLDLFDPVGAISVDGGASHTLDRDVTVNVSPAPDLAEIAVGLSTLNCATATYAAYTTSTPTYQLPVAGGSYTVKACFRDASGRTAFATDDITYDAAAPTLSSVVINAAAATTVNPVVTVALTASDPPLAELAHMIVSEDSAFAGATWETFATTRSFTLSSTEGTRTIYAKVRDAAGRESATQSDTIVLDLERPVIASFTHATGYEADRTFAFALDASDNVSAAGALQVSVAQGAACGSTFVPYSTTPTFTLPGGFGTGTYPISACVRDAAGRTSLPATAIVRFDDAGPTAPTGVTAVPGSRQVLLSWLPSTDVGVAGVAQYQVETDDDAAFGSPVTALTSGPTTELVVADVDNRITWYFRVRAVDAAGNAGPWSASASATTGLVSINPATTVLTFQGTRTDASPSLLTVGDNLFIALPHHESGAIGQATGIRVQRCEYAASDCRESASWSSYVIPTQPFGTQRVALATVGLEVYATIVENRGATNAVTTYICRTPLGCDEAGDWFNIDVDTPTATTLVDHVAFAAATARIVVASGVRVGPNKFVRISTCALVSGCSTGLDWASVTLADAAITDETFAGGFSLDAWDDRVLLGFTGASGALRTRACATSAGCQDLADWSPPTTLQSPPGDPGGTDYTNSAVATTKNAGYVAFVTDSTSDIRVARCDRGTCSAGAFGIADTLVVGGSKEPITLSSSRDALHLAAWDAATSTVRYGICRRPNSNDCGKAAFWRVIALDEEVPARTAPAALGFDGNVAIAWIDVESRLRVALPSIPTPAGFTALPAVGGARLSWRPLTFLEGYDVLFDADGGPGWDNATTLPIPTSASVSATLTGAQYFGLIGLGAGGQPSDDSRSFRVAPFSSVVIPEVPPVTDESSFCPYDQPGVCRPFTSGGSATRSIAATTDAAAEPFASFCDADTDDCASAEWSTVTLTSFPTSSIAPIPIRALATEGHYVTAWLANTGATGNPFAAQDLVVAVCATSNDCTDEGNWELTKPVDLSGSDQLDAALTWDGHDNVFASYRNASGNLAGVVCDLETDCKVGGDWSTFTGLPSVPVNAGTLTASAIRNPADPTSGVLGLAYTKTVLAVTYTEFVACRYTLTSPSSGTCQPGAVRIAGVDTYMLRNAASDTVQALALVDQGALLVMTCVGDPFSCANYNQWGITKIADVDKTLPGALDIAARPGGHLLVSYVDKRRLRFASCDEHCARDTSWRTGTAATSATLSAPTRNARHLVLPSGPTVRVGLVDATNAPVSVLMDGEYEPAD